jgi:hypothetical protein
MRAPSPEPRCGFGMRETLSLSPEPRRSFGMRETLSPSPEPKRNFGMRETLSLSPEPKRDFGMRETLSLSPEPKRDFGMRETLSLSPEPKCNFGMQATPSPLPEPGSNFGVQVTRSPSPAPKGNSDFGMRESLSPEPQDDFEMQAAPSTEPQVFGTRAPLSHKGPAHLQRGGAARAISPLPHAEDFGGPTLLEEGNSQISSSSKKRGEIHIACFCTHLTLVDAVWKWGELPPTPIKSKQKDLPATIGEGEGIQELVL